MFVALFLLFALIVVVVGALVVALARISGNVGLLTLEDLARRNDVVYLPISRQLAGELEGWSKPLRIRIVTHGDAPVAEIIMTKKLSDEEPS